MNIHFPKSYIVLFGMFGEKNYIQRKKKSRYNAQPN